MTNKTTDEVLRQRSGSVNSSDPLVVFLYLLLRDELTSGDIERIMRDLEVFDGDAAFSNGWSAQYAVDLAERIRSAGKGCVEECPVHSQ